MPHAFAKVGKTRSTKREPFDQYETPEGVTEALLRHVRFSSRIVEPAAGSGKIARVLRSRGYRVETSDIQRGNRDFLKRTTPCDNVVTNPPYGGKLPELFVKKALELATGRVAMLLKHGFLWSSGRREWLTENPPTTIIIISNRIRFTHPNGKKIKGQFFDHWWLVWGEPFAEIARHGSQRIIFEEERT